MKCLSFAMVALFVGCAHQPSDVTDVSKECASRFELLEVRYCAFERAERSGATPPEDLGVLTRESALFVAECGQDHPDFETACDGR